MDVGQAATEYQRQRAATDQEFRSVARPLYGRTQTLTYYHPEMLLLTQSGRLRMIVSECGASQVSPFSQDETTLGFFDVSV
jgi:hypothetical protein